MITGYPVIFYYEREYNVFSIKIYLVLVFIIEKILHFIIIKI
jgi:hypothetical protein